MSTPEVLRFAILEHDHPYLHWDFLLESRGYADCWRLLRRPVVNEPIAAERLEPHRLMYLDYEGPVSGGRGTVRKFATGVFCVEADGEPHHDETWCGSVIQSVQLRDVTLFRQCCLATRHAVLIRSKDGRDFWIFSTP